MVQLVRLVAWVAGEVDPETAEGIVIHCEEDADVFNVSQMVAHTILQAHR